MSDQYKWGPWVEHDGCGCPLAAGVFFEVEFHAALCRGIYRKAGFLTEKMRAAPDWEIQHPYDPVAPQILRYRIRKPRALQQLRDLVENLPCDVTEDALT